MHTIYIRDLRVSATHGCYSFEKEKPQTFVVSITATVNDWSHHDSLEETLNYELLRNIAHAVLAESPKNLVETLADEMADKVLAFSQIESVTVSLEKHGIFPDCVAGVSVIKKKQAPVQ